MELDSDSHLDVGTAWIECTHFWDQIFTPSVPDMRKTLERDYRYHTRLAKQSATEHDQLAHAHLAAETMLYLEQLPT